MLTSMRKGLAKLVLSAVILNVICVIFTIYSYDPYSIPATPYILALIVGIVAYNYLVR
jgi:hypothetical protein